MRWLLASESLYRWLLGCRTLVHFKGAGLDIAEPGRCPSELSGSPLLLCAEVFSWDEKPHPSHNA